MVTLELEAREVAVLVQILSLAETENVLVANDNNEMTMLENLPEVETLMLKINALGNEDEVKAFIEKKFGTP